LGFDKPFDTVQCALVIKLKKKERPKVPQYGRAEGETMRVKHCLCF